MKRTAASTSREMIDAERVLVSLDAYTHPDIGRPLQLVRNLSEPLGAFGQDLVCVPRGVSHDGEHVSDEAERNVLVEQIAH